MGLRAQRVRASPNPLECGRHPLRHPLRHDEQRGKLRFRSDRFGAVLFVFALRCCGVDVYTRSGRNTVSRGAAASRRLSVEKKKMGPTVRTFTPGVFVRLVSERLETRSHHAPATRSL